MGRNSVAGSGSGGRNRDARHMVSFRDYLLASWMGMLPGTLMYVYLGSTVRNLADVVAGRVHQDLWDRARTFALLNMALADSYIAGWDSKYHHNTWRPVTAIQLAESDGNPLTEPADPTWTPFLATPNHPEYPAAHTCGSYALYDTMRAFFGGDTPIRIQTINPPAAVSPSIRTYDKFNDIEKEIVDARVFGGMHFRHSAMNGAQLGRKVAKNLVDNFFRATSAVARRHATGRQTAIATR